MEERSHSQTHEIASGVPSLCQVLLGPWDIATHQNMIHAIISWVCFKQVTQRFVGREMGIRSGGGWWCNGRSLVLALAVGLLLLFWGFAVLLLQLLFLWQKASMPAVTGGDSYLTVWGIQGFRLHQFLPHQFAVGLL